MIERHLLITLLHQAVKDFHRRPLVVHMMNLFDLLFPLHFNRISKRQPISIGLSRQLNHAVSHGFTFIVSTKSRTLSLFLRTFRFLFLAIPLDAISSSGILEVEVL